MPPPLYDCLTITLNPAIDRTITIPDFAAGKVNRVQGETWTAGGKGVNVASSLADAGYRVAATGFLGSDNDAIFQKHFARKSITDLFVRIEGETRTGIKITDPTNQQTTDINFAGVSPQATDLRALRHALDCSDARWFVLSGSLPPDVVPTIYRDLVMALISRGRKVALDVSGLPLRYAIDGTPTLIKPNIHELSELVGRTLTSPSEVIQAARQLLSTGIETIVVSMGGEGACFVTADETLLAQPPAIEIRTTVGAGDAMVAGLVSAALRGLTLAETARLATAFSLRAIAATPPSPGTVDAFAHDVVVTLV